MMMEKNTDIQWCGLHWAQFGKMVCRGRVAASQSCHSDPAASHRNPWRSHRPQHLVKKNYTQLKTFTRPSISTVLHTCQLGGSKWQTKYSANKENVLTKIIMYIYHALVNTLSTHVIHINLNMIFYTHVEHSPTKTTWSFCFFKYALPTHTHTPTYTHPHNDSSWNWVLILVRMEILGEEEGFQFGFKRRQDTDTKNPLRFNTVVFVRKKGTD